MANKGFKAKKKPNKKEVVQQNSQLQQLLEQVQGNMQFLGQQVFQSMQRSQALDKEVGAMAGLLRFNEQPEGAAAKEGDAVMIDFSGIIKETGKTFQGGYSLGTLVNIGSNTFIPGFEEALVGLKVGEVKTINVTFPEKYPKELANKEAEFTVQVQKIWSPREDDSKIAMLHADRLKAEKAEVDAKAEKEAASEASKEESNS